MLVNVVDVPPLCNFILPAIVRTGPLAIAISTAGASPALAKRIKRQIADEFGEPYARLAVLLNDVRGWAKGTLPTYQDRKAFFEGIVNGEPDPIELLRAGDEAAVRRADRRGAARARPAAVCLLTARGDPRRHAAAASRPRSARPSNCAAAARRRRSAAAWAGAPATARSCAVDRALGSRAIRTAVLTVSTSVSRREKDDLSGPTLAAAAEEAGCEVVAMEVVPDDFALIEDRLHHYVDAGVRPRLHHRRDRPDAGRHHARGDARGDRARGARLRRDDARGGPEVHAATASSPAASRASPDAR